MTWKSARGGNLEPFQIFLGMCLAVVRFVAFCVPWNMQEFSKLLFPKTSPLLAFPSRLFSLYIVCPNCCPLPSMAAVKTFAFKYFSQTLPPPTSNKTNTNTFLTTSAMGKLGEIKASHQTDQKKKLQFFEKRFILFPLVLVTHIKNVGCCLSRLSLS